MARGLWSFLRGAFFGCVDAYDMEGVRHMNTIQTQSIVNGIELVFSDDNTEVYVTIKNPTMSFSKEKVLKYLKDIGVTTGIDYADVAIGVHRCRMGIVVVR